MLVFFGWKQKAILAESGQSARLQAVLELGVRKVLQPGHSVQQHVPIFPIFLQCPTVTVETGGRRAGLAGGPSVSVPLCKVLSWASLRTICPLSAPGWVRPLSAVSQVSGSGTFWTLAAPVAFWRLWPSACRGLSRGGLGVASGGTGREQSQQGGVRGTSVWAGVLESALAPGVEWPRLAVAPALACHRRPRWR